MNKEEQLQDLGSRKNLTVSRVKFYGQEYFYVKTRRGNFLKDGWGLLHDEAIEAITEYQNSRTRYHEKNLR